MPTVQYVNEYRQVRETRQMPTPKRITELRYWLRGAQQAIPKIPRNIAEAEGMADNSIGSDGWFVYTSDVDVKWVKFTIQNRIHERAHIVINRQTNALGV